MKKLLIFSLLLWGITFRISIAQGTAAENLIRNAGFEDQGTTPGGWIIGGPVKSMVPVTGIDDKVKFNGHYSLKMESLNPNCHGKAFQTLKVVTGQTYEVKARFRTENVKSIDRSVLIRIKWFDGDKQLGYNYISDIESDDNGWLLASDKIRAVPGSTAAEIALEFRWSTGNIWWDDISMQACAVVPARKIKVGTVYYRPQGPTVADNIKNMAGLLDKAGRSGCDIVCLPEGWPTCNTELGMTKTEVNSLGGSASEMMASKASQYSMYIVSGLYNWSGDTLFNVAALYNRNGGIEGVYKKVQLPDSESEQGAVPGNSLPVFKTDFGTIGILICWDIISPEISRILALKGADVLFCPIWGDVRTSDSWKITARSRAMDNSVYFVTSIYDGHSLIIDPAGDILQESGTQGTLITADIDLNFNPPWDWIGNAGRGFWKSVWRKDRRPDLFDKLVEFRNGH